MSNSNFNSSYKSSSEEILEDYAIRYEQLLLSKRNLEKDLKQIQTSLSSSTSLTLEAQSTQAIRAMSSLMAENAAMNGMLTSAIESCQKNVAISQDAIDGLQCLLINTKSDQEKPESLSRQLFDSFAQIAFCQDTSDRLQEIVNQGQQEHYQGGNIDASLNDFFSSYPNMERRSTNLTTDDSDDTSSDAKKHRWIDLLESDSYIPQHSYPQQQQQQHPIQQTFRKTETSSWDTYTSNGSSNPNPSSLPKSSVPTSAFRTASEFKMNSYQDNDPTRDNDSTTAASSTDHPPYPITNPYSVATTRNINIQESSSQLQSSVATESSQYNPNRPTLTAGLKKKFQLPKPRMNTNSSSHSAPSKRQATATSTQGNTSSSSHQNNQEEELPEELQHLDAELVRKIENEICDSGEPITFQDIAGLKDAKQTVMELVCWPMKRPDLFTGLRRGPNGLLLFGPPGTGKTLIGKAIAHESGATFFSISSSSLTSKWIGEGEKLVRTLFAVAAYREPAVVFIDEIDSLLTQRKADENEASRRIKTEFLVQLDGTGTSGQGRVLVIGATNRPHELDDAARRRFVKRLYIPLPEAEDREILLRTLLAKNHNSLTDKDITKLSIDTNGFSGADLKALCTDAALGPIRQLGNRALEIAASDIPPISYKHFRQALKGMNASVAQSDLDSYLDFNRTYGSKSVTAEDYDGLSDDDST